MEQRAHVGLVLDDEDAQSGELLRQDGRAIGGRRRARGAARRGLGRRFGQAYGERRAAAGAVAACLDLAAVELDQVLDDREAEAEAAGGARHAHLGLAKRLEYVGQEARL